MARYEVLHYRGDVADNLTEGQILGCDDFGRPFAVIDAEPEFHCPHGTDHPRCQVRTAVHLEYATPEQLTAALDDARQRLAAVPSFAAFRPAPQSVVRP